MIKRNKKDKILEDFILGFLKTMAPNPVAPQEVIDHIEGLPEGSIEERVFQREISDAIARLISRREIGLGRNFDLHLIK